jgi:hypothetical protein
MLASASFVSKGTELRPNQRWYTAQPRVLITELLIVTCHTVNYLLGVFVSSFVL